MSPLSERAEPGLCPDFRWRLEAGKWGVAASVRFVACRQVDSRFATSVPTGFAGPHQTRSRLRATPRAGSPALRQMSLVDNGSIRLLLRSRYGSTPRAGSFSAQSRDVPSRHGRCRLIDIRSMPMCYFDSATTNLLASLQLFADMACRDPGKNGPDRSAAGLCHSARDSEHCCR